MTDAIITNIGILFLILTASTIVSFIITFAMVWFASISSNVRIVDMPPEIIFQARAIAFLILIICTIIGALGAWVI